MTLLKKLGVALVFGVLVAPQCPALDDEKGEMTIHQAAQKGNILWFQYLNETQKVDTNQPDEDGNTPLMLALMGYQNFKQMRQENPSQFYGYPVNENGEKIVGGEPDMDTVPMLIGAQYYNIINSLLYKHPDLSITNKMGVSVKNLLNTPEMKNTFKMNLEFLELMKEK